MGITNEVASKYFVASSDLDLRGKFTLILNEGVYYLCLVNDINQAPDANPVPILGCVEVELQKGQKLDLDIVSAFGGISLEN
jgi:hypothetical protein